MQPPIWSESDPLANLTSVLANSYGGAVIAQRTKLTRLVDHNQLVA
jgi:hypothetical protein